MRFVAFVVSEAVCTGTAAVYLLNSFSTADPFMRWLVTGVLTGVDLLLFMTTFGLSVFHWYLALTNKTTYDFVLEDRRSANRMATKFGVEQPYTRITSHGEEYDEGWCQNVRLWFAGESRPRFTVAVDCPPPDEG